VEEPFADEGEIRPSVFAQHDQLAVEYGVSRQSGEFRDERRHVPAAAAPDAKTLAGADDRAEAVPLQLKRVAVGAWQRAQRASIGSGNTIAASLRFSANRDTQQKKLWRPCCDFYSSAPAGGSAVFGGAARSSRAPFERRALELGTGEAG
jgi:hypothetical protein